MEAKSVNHLINLNRNAWKLMFMDSLAETLWCVLMWGVEVSDVDFEFYRKESTIDTFDTVADMLAGMIQMPDDMEDDKLGEAECARERAIEILSGHVNDLAGGELFHGSSVREFCEAELYKALAVKVSDIVEYALGNMEAEYPDSDVDEVLWEAMFNANYDITVINSSTLEEKIEMIGVDISTGELKLSYDQVKFCMLYTDSAQTLYEYIFKDIFEEDKDDSNVW